MSREVLVYACYGNIQRQRNDVGELSACLVAEQSTRRSSDKTPLQHTLSLSDGMF